MLRPQAMMLRSQTRKTRKWCGAVVRAPPSALQEALVMRVLLDDWDSDLARHCGGTARSCSDDDWVSDIVRHCGER